MDIYMKFENTEFKRSCFVVSFHKTVCLFLVFVLFFPQRKMNHRDIVIFHNEVTLESNTRKNSGLRIKKRVSKMNSTIIQVYSLRQVGNLSRPCRHCL